MVEFDQLCKRKREEDNLKEYYNARIECMLYNTHRGDNKPLQIDDFMSSKLPKKEVKQDWKQMQNAAKILTAAFNGKIK